MPPTTLSRPYSLGGRTVVKVVVGRQPKRRKKTIQKDRKAPQIFGKKSKFHLKICLIFASIG